MMRGLILPAFLALLAPASQHLPADQACRSERFEGDDFLSCTFDPARHELRLIRRQADGRPAGLQDLRQTLGADAARTLFAMNAGMYDPARAPLGLYVTRGRIEQPINRRKGGGNFFLKPNGIFWIDHAGRPHVDETEAFAQSNARPVWATQSGPLLVRAGALHPAVNPNGSSVNVRNAVGIKDGRAIFVISEQAVSFGRLARFMRDRLGCSDVLYLDGSVSSLWVPDIGRLDRRSDLGTFVVVMRKTGR